MKLKFLILFSLTVSALAFADSTRCRDGLATSAATTVEELRRQSEVSDHEIQIPAMARFTDEDIEVLRKGATTRPPSVTEVPEALRTFKTSVGLDILIAKPGFYQQRTALAARWNPAVFPTASNAFAQKCERVVMDRLTTQPAVDLVKDLSQTQQHLVQHLLLNRALIGVANLDDAAEAIAVARALALDESSTSFHGVPLAEWAKRIAHNNQALKEHGPSLKDWLAHADRLQAQFLQQVETQAQQQWQSQPEREYKDILAEVLEKSLLQLKEFFTKHSPGEYSRFTRELQIVIGEWTQIAVYGEWLTQRGQGRPPHWYANADEVRKAAETNEQLTQLARVLSEQQARLTREVLEKAQQAWIAQPTQDYHEILRGLFASALDVQKIRSEVAQQFSGLGNAPYILLQDQFGAEAQAQWVTAQTPDLSFGETIIPLRAKPIIEIPEASGPLIDKLAKVGEIGGPADLALLKEILAVFNPEFLKELDNAGYEIIVARNNVTNGARDLRARRTASNDVVDRAEGIHVPDPDGRPRIVVRTYMQDGFLVLDVLHFLHEIGHAIDLVLRRNGNQALHVQKEFADAFTAEHKLLPSYFHDQAEFAAEVFARFALDRERAERVYTQSAKAFEKHGLGKVLIGLEKLVKLYQSMLAEAPVTARPNPRELMAQNEKLNLIRQKQGKNREPLILELQGERAASFALAKNLATDLVTMRAPATGPFGRNDGFVYISAKTFNDPAALQQLLDTMSDSHGAVLYVDELSTIPPTSPGFRMLSDFFVRMGDLAILVLAGSPDELKPLAHALPTIPRRPIKIETMTPQQVAELVRRDIVDDGYELSREALALLVEQTTSGGYEAAIGRWRNIKLAQMNRTAAMAHAVGLQPESISYVLARDVAAGKTNQPNPVEEIGCMIGLADVKTQVQCIISSVAVAQREIELGLQSEDPPRLNLLFAGNPGVGKTMVAKKLAEGLFQLGYVKRKVVAEFKIQDLLTGKPEASVKAMFETYKNGTIFIDEFHQLYDTEEGKRAFRAMIPYLTDPEYRNTVFIGAGYTEELRDLIRDVDRGGERRYVTIKFADYNRQSMYLIGEKMLKDLRLQASDEVKQVLLERVMRKQRAMKHPGNAGDMETVIKLSRQKQRDRLAGLILKGPVTAEQMLTLTLEDVAEEPRLSVADVWKEIDSLKGMEKTKAKLRNIQNLFDYNKEMKVDILTGVEPYVVVEGPAGSGKSTLAALIGRFFAANDVIPDETVIEAKGSDLLGGYVGNSTPLAVRKKFEEAWGRTLFIDEIGGLANAVGGYEDQAAKEILTQTENNRGKFVLVIADYPKNIEEFFKLDAGLPRRFGTRFTLEAMSARAATDLLHDRLKDVGLNAHHLDSQIMKDLEVIAALPSWASGGDVRTLAGKVRTFQAAEFMASKSRGETMDPHKVHPMAITRAMDELRIEVSKRPKPKGTEERAQAPHDHQFEHQAKTQGAGEHEAQEVAPLSEDEKKTLQVMNEVDRQFGDRLNDPQALEQQENDPQSEYNVALGEKLGVDPAAARDMRQSIRKKIKISIQVLEQEAIQHFKYHCPYCGGIDSPSCAYINHSLEWKIEHSLRKPWVETREVLREKTIE